MQSKDSLLFPQTIGPTLDGLVFKMLGSKMFKDIEADTQVFVSTLTVMFAYTTSER